MVGVCATSAAQDLFKPISAKPGSLTNEKVNAAIDRYVHGDFVGAMKLFDEASLADLNSSLPWIDGALNNVRLGRFAVAYRAYQQATSMGERSARADVIGSDIQIARSQFSTARSKIKDAEFLDPEDPFTHVAWANYYTQTSQLRAAERSQWQAYRSGRAVLMDSVLATDSRFGASIGANSEISATGNFNFYRQGVGIQSRFEIMTGLAGGSTDALQKVGRADVAADVSAGTFVATYRTLDSDRPGIALPSIGISTASGSKLVFNYLMGGWQKKFGDFTAHLDYRSSTADLRPFALAQSGRNNFETQWIGEGRFDRGNWTSGVGASTVYRSGSMTPAIEPLEEVFGLGRTNLGHAFVVNRTTPSKNSRLITGAVLTGVGGVNHLFATGELAIRMLGNRYLKLGSKPTMDRIGTNLWPEDLLGENVVSNPIDRVFGSSLEFNRTPLLPGATGSGSEQYLSIPILDRANLSTGIRLFRRSFENSFALGADPIVSNNLYQSPLSRGSLVGIQQQTTLALTSNVGLHFDAAYQSSQADYSLPIRNLNDYSLSSESRIPNVPNIHATIGLDWNAGDLSTAFTLNYVGQRVAAITTAEGTSGMSSTFIQNVPAAWGMDFHASTPVAGGILHFAVLNLANAHFYLGSDSNRTLQISYTGRY